MRDRMVTGSFTGKQCRITVFGRELRKLGRPRNALSWRYFDKLRQPLLERSGDGRHVLMSLPVAAPPPSRPDPPPPVRPRPGSGYADGPPETGCRLPRAGARPPSATRRPQTGAVAAPRAPIRHRAMLPFSFCIILRWSPRPRGCDPRRAQPRRSGRRVLRRARIRAGQGGLESLDL